MKLFAFILSVFFPGIGQVLLSRHTRGVIIFFSIIILLDLSIIIIPLLAPPSTSRIYPTESLRSTLYVLCLCIYLYNLWDIFNIVYWSNRRASREKKKTILKKAITHYLKQDLNASRDELKKALKLDKEDIDVLYYLSKVESGSGRTAQEKRIRNKIRTLDLENKYTI